MYNYLFWFVADYIIQGQFLTAYITHTATKVSRFTSTLIVPYIFFAVITRGSSNTVFMSWFQFRL